MFASLMNGLMLRRVKDISLLTLARLISWLKNTVLELIQAVKSYDYRFAAGVVMWAIRQRWHVFKMRWPVYQQLAEWQRAYWEMHDQWSAADLEYRSLYVKHQDLLDEVRYWETRHAKIMNFIEKQMEMSEIGGTK